MKTILIVALAFSLGIVFQNQFKLATVLGVSTKTDDGGEAHESAEKQPLYWVAPMDKNFRKDGPGKSPMGMDLVPVYEEDSSDSGIRIPAHVQQNLGVKVASAEHSVLSQPIHTVGIIEYDESRIMHIHTRVEGWIEKLYVSSTGDPVKKGQTLFELYSPVLVNAQKEFLLELKRGNKQLIRSSKSKLKSLGMTDAHIQQIQRKRRVMELVGYRAQFDGVVKMLNVRHGMHIEPATELISIASLDSVWVRADVFERQAYQVYQGQDALVELNAFPGDRWPGLVNYVYPELDESTRTLQTRIRVNNPEHRLKPNMLANITLETGQSEAVVHVPFSSVIKGKYVNRVVKSVGDGSFKSVAVELGESGYLNGQKRLAITKGINPGDEVVVSAQFLIDSESNIDAELMRMSLESDGSVSNPANAVITKASFNRLQNAMGMVNVTHAPIPEWGWPVMTMEFQVAPDLDLSKVILEQDLMVEIVKGDNHEFVITRVGDHLEPSDTSARLERDAGNHSNDMDKMHMHH